MNESVVNSSGSRLSRFGLYRTIDERTEEFLKLSKKRQVKHGCVCAAISTFVTVVIVIVILLIYEYAIAVESSLVQRMRDASRASNDTPVAEKLDRSYLGFDQDYFEQMPLLVNAMQENSYNELGVDMTPPPKIDKRGKFVNIIQKKSSYDEYFPIRRTSPRPFVFEYRSPTPAPFHKKYNSRSWIDSYRNAQRMKNLEQVINYLEKTINAKFGDLYSLPSSTHVAFSGVYVQPTSSESKSKESDITGQSSENIPNTFRYSDPLFIYKPQSPGDVNLLADAPLKFSPTPILNVIPMFKPVPNIKGCIGIKCGVNNPNKLLNLVSGSAEIKTTHPSIFDKANTFSVIMNLIPMSSTTMAPQYSIPTTQLPLEKIYFTTSRPEYQFRRKSSGSLNQSKRTSYIIRPKKRKLKSNTKVYHDNSRSSVESSGSSASNGANMILTVKIFPKAEVTSSTEYSVTSFTPNTLNFSQVEDHHVGSSGLIPVNLDSFSTTEQSQDNTATTEFHSDFTSEAAKASWASSPPPEVMKFSQEDAKVPEQYQRIMEIQETYNRNYHRELNRRNSMESYEVKIDSEPSTSIATKLKNEDISLSNEYKDEPESTTATNTYVPQINGHYRSINLNSNKINNWMNDNMSTSKRNIEIIDNTHRTYVPNYVDIRRNRRNDDNN